MVQHVLKLILMHSGRALVEVQDSTGGARLPKLLEEVLQDRSEEKVSLTEPRHQTQNAP